MIMWEVTTEEFNFDGFKGCLLQVQKTKGGTMASRVGGRVKDYLMALL
jgi:hypothetical protein